MRKTADFASEVQKKINIEILENNIKYIRASVMTDDKTRETDDRRFLSRISNPRNLSKRERVSREFSVFSIRAPSESTAAFSSRGWLR